MSHQHDRIYTDEETSATIGSHQIPIPMNWKVLVQPNQVKMKTAGGILLPDTSKDNDTFDFTKVGTDGGPEPGQSFSPSLSWIPTEAYTGGGFDLDEYTSAETHEEATYNTAEWSSDGITE